MPSPPTIEEVLARLPVAVATFDADGRVLTATGGGYALMGLRATDTVGVALDAPGTRTPLVRAVSAALVGRQTSFAMELDGRWWQCHVVPAPVGGGGYLVGSAADETTRDVARLEQVLASAPVCVCGFDRSGVITYASGSGYARLGLDPAQLLGESAFEAFGASAVVVASVADTLAGKDVDVVVEHGGLPWELHYRSALAADGTVSGGLCVAQDATHWAASRTQPAVTPMPSADPKVDLLTGLLSRQAVAELLAVPLADEEGVAVLVDVDAFAMVNEVHGHAAGDAVLVALADRLRYVAGSSWQVGRWSDDVFALVCRAPEAVRELNALVARIAGIVADPVEEGSARLQVTVSIGTASSAHCPAGELLTCAGLALRAAKQAGRDQVQHYSTRLRSTPAKVPRLAAELRAAMAHDEVGLHYQPVVGLADRRATGVEALARWSHPERGLLLPAHFIPLAERTGLIVPLGERLLRQACHTAAAWQRDPPCAESLTMAVNLSARQLTHPGLVAMVRDALTVSGCRPEGLTIEVTETAVMSDLDVAVATLSELKDLGLGIALDDFGTGYSSLVYLKRFPVDTLKIDGSFVAGLGVDPDDTAIVTSLVSLAHSVGVVCVAEGVETAEQLDVLESLGCDLAQGYVFGRALDPVAIRTWLGRQRQGPTSRSAPERTAPDVDAVTLDRVLALHHEGASLHTIAARLNVEGRRTSKGSRWHHTSVALVIAAAVGPVSPPGARVRGSTRDPGTRPGQSFSSGA